LVRPSTTTDVITSSASDIAHPHTPRCQLCPGTGVNYVVKSHTAPATSFRLGIYGFRA
jgi:hypothetical protein